MEIQKTQIQIKISVEEKKIILEASKILSIGYSTFCRSFALEKARQILKENKE